MKRLRISRCTERLLRARSGTAVASPYLVPIAYRSSRFFQPVRLQSTSDNAPPAATTSPVPEQSLADEDSLLAIETAAPTALPSPPIENALSSAKLAAIHARLSLTDKVPLQTLARALIDPSADPSPNFNNANLALVGSNLLSYHTSEYLAVRYPRLPMAIMFEAIRAYVGPASLHRVARQWGVDSAAHPGEEVDPGLLQWSKNPNDHLEDRSGYIRKEATFLEKFKWRRGVSSRITYDDEFGDTVHASSSSNNDAAIGREPLPDEVRRASERQLDEISEAAHASFVRAVVGAIYVHRGREAVADFIRAHILSRRVNLDQLFRFKLPTRELAMLCAREGFEPPVARLISETGRLSRTPVYVVGIYSGADKLGEGAAASLNFARLQAAMNALKAWYLYSPGAKVRVPSDMLVEGAKPWKPAYIDMGEII